MSRWTVARTLDSGNRVELEIYSYRLFILHFEKKGLVLETEHLHLGRFAVRMEPEPGPEARHC